MKRHFLILIFTFSFIILNVNCGILDWFRSKPAWISKIDKYPLVEAFQPNGLRVSIADVEGLEKFGFHGKLNQCFGRAENGTFFGYVTQPTNGRWVFVDDLIQLKVGDALHFWIYVKVKGEEHQFSKNVRIINNLIPKPLNVYDLHPTIPTSHHVDNNLNPELCPCDQLNILSTYASTSSMFPTFQPTPSINSENIICKSQVDSLTEVILNMVKDEFTNANLVLTGKEITNRSAVDEIVSLLTQMELFDLNDKIRLAYYLNCGIYFEMSSIVDKKRIMFRASTDLKNSIYKFVEPEQATCKIDKENEAGVDIRIKDNEEFNAVNN